MTEIPIACSFRQEILTPLTGKLQDGYSCSLVGVGSSGKSNVVRHLLRQDVRAHYWGADAERVLYLYLDLDALQSYDEDVVYAKLISILRQTLAQRSDETAGLSALLETQWREVVSNHSAVLAREYLAQALDRLFTTLIQVVIVFDDCDRLVAQVKGEWLRGMRALRNDYKGRLMYVTVSRKELSQLRPRSPDLETFFELFAQHLLFVGPYREADALGMLARLAGRQNEAARPLQQEEIQRILELSGQHAGLISAVYKLTNRYSDSSAVDLGSPHVIQRLMTRKLIRAECEKITDSLPPSESQALQHIANGTVEEGSAVRVLKRKGLVRENVDGALTVFSPLVREHARHLEQSDQLDSTSDELAGDALARPPTAHEPLVTERATHTVRVGAWYVQPEPAQFALVEELAHRMPASCTAEELLMCLVGVNEPEVSYTRLDARLRELNQLLVETGYRVTSIEGSYKLETSRP